MFSLTGEYALRVVVYLGSRPGVPATTRDIAAATRVPVGYLSKVLQALSRGGLVRSQRGLGGGSALTRPAEQVTVYDVVSAVDPIRRIGACPPGLSHGPELCPLHKRLDHTLELVETELKAVTIQSLVDEGAGVAVGAPAPSGG